MSFKDIKGMLDFERFKYQNHLTYSKLWGSNERKCSYLSFNGWVTEMLSKLDVCCKKLVSQKGDVLPYVKASLMRAHHKCYLKMFITGLTNQLKSSNSKMYFVLVIALHGRAMKLHFFEKPQHSHSGLLACAGKNKKRNKRLPQKPGMN